MSLYLAWSSAGVPIRDENNPDGNLSLPVGVPGTTSTPVTLDLHVDSDPQATDTLENVRFYLSGPDALAVGAQWPSLGTTSHPELNGGLEISFDGGRTYTRFDLTHGNLSLPATWIPLPVSATAFGSIPGELLAFDTAAITLRLVVPPGVTSFQQYQLSVEVDCDVV